jgi:hypothetical protein
MASNVNQFETSISSIIGSKKKISVFNKLSRKKLEKNKKGERTSCLDISRFEDLNKGGVID